MRRPRSVRRRWRDREGGRDHRAPTAENRFGPRDSVASTRSQSRQGKKRPPRAKCRGQTRGRRDKSRSGSSTDSTQKMVCDIYPRARGEGARADPALSKKRAIASARISSSIEYIEQLRRSRFDRRKRIDLTLSCPPNCCEGLAVSFRAVANRPPTP